MRNMLRLLLLTTTCSLVALTNCAIASAHSAASPTSKLPHSAKCLKYAQNPRICAVTIHTAVVDPRLPLKVDGKLISRAPGVFRSDRPASFPSRLVGAPLGRQVTPQEGMSEHPAPGQVNAAWTDGCWQAADHVAWADDIAGFTIWKTWQHVWWCAWSWAVDWNSLWGYNDVYTMPGWSADDRVWTKQWVNAPATAVAISSMTMTGPSWCIPWTSTCITQHDYPTMLTFVNGAGSFWFG